jgi:hypothetical protein
MVRRADRRELMSVTRAATTGRETATTGDRKSKLIYMLQYRIALEISGILVDTKL